MPRRNNAKPASKNELLSWLLKHSTDQYRVLVYIVRMWLAINQALQTIDIKPSDKLAQEHKAKFVRAHGLTSIAHFKQWYCDNDLNEDELERLLLTSAQFDHVVTKSNWDVFGISYQDNGIWWYLDALKLTGNYRVLQLENNL